MKLSFSHPLWLHLPAVAVLAVVVGMLIQAGPLPAEGPTHFGWSGQPDQYGSPAGAFALFIGVFLAFFLVLLPLVWNQLRSFVTELPGMLDEYYEYRGCSSDGLPTRKRLEEIGLKDVADDLARYAKLSEERRPSIAELMCHSTDTAERAVPAR